MAARWILSTGEECGKQEEFVGSLGLRQIYSCLSEL